MFVTTAEPAVQTPTQRWEAVTGELAELCGQQNAIAGRITELLAQVEDEQLLGGTGVRSLEHFATWKLGVSPGRARALTAIARRRDGLPATTGLLEAGLVSEDQAAVIARQAPAGTDDHYAALARYATVAQLRTALRAAPQPPEDPPAGEPHQSRRDVSAGWLDDDHWGLRARLDKLDGSVVDTALRAHHDALVAHWKRHRNDDEPDRRRPSLADALVRMAQHSLDAATQLRPHGQRTTVVVHVDLDHLHDRRHAQLHLGPALTDAERRHLTCDARFEVWFERHGTPIGVGRSTREIPRRLRRALEHRTGGRCQIPGCDTTQGLHAHHLRHWEDGGHTELDNLALICGHHHRAHHDGTITIRGPAHHITVTDHTGQPITARSLARAPTRPPPDTARYPGTSGHHAQWHWYQPPEPTHN